MRTCLHQPQFIISDAMHTPTHTHTCFHRYCHDTKNECFESSTKAKSNLTTRMRGAILPLLSELFKGMRIRDKSIPLCKLLTHLAKVHGSTTHNCVMDIENNLCLGSVREAFWKTMEMGNKSDAKVSSKHVCSCSNPALTQCLHPCSLVHPTR